MSKILSQAFGQFSEWSHSVGNEVLILIGTHEFDRPKELCGETNVMSRSSDIGEGALANFPFVDTDDAGVARARTSALLIPHDLEVHRGLLPFRAVHRHAALSTISLH